MRALIQRVSKASVHVNSELIASIDAGLITLLGIHQDDVASDADWLIRKIVSLRIFEDETGKMNRSLADTGGEHLIVSQFTLWADVSKGNRPSFTRAARPETAKPLYEHSIQVSRSMGITTLGGIFGANMQVTILNDGPVTILLDSPEKSDSN